MKQSTRSALLIGILLPLVFSPSVSGQLPRLDSLMEEKLEHAQDLLEAMILADYDAVERSSNELIRVSEDSQWSPSQDPGYLRRARDFRETANTLIEQAKAGHADGVALAYMEMTLTCIQCHKRLRGGRQAD